MEEICRGNHAAFDQSGSFFSQERGQLLHLTLTQFCIVVRHNTHIKVYTVITSWLLNAEEVELDSCSRFQLFVG